MPMKLLEQLSSMALPASFEDIDDIAKIQALRAAGLLEARLSPVLLLADGSRYAGPATAVRLTERGTWVASQRDRACTGLVAPASTHST